MDRSTRSAEPSGLSGPTAADRCHHVVVPVPRHIICCCDNGQRSLGDLAPFLFALRATERSSRLTTILTISLVLSYADDISLLSSTVEGAQRLLPALRLMCLRPRSQQNIPRRRQTSEALPDRQRAQLWQAVVETALLHNTETWTLTATLERKLVSAHSGCSMRPFELTRARCTHEYSVPGGHPTKSDGRTSSDAMKHRWQLAATILAFPLVQLLLNVDSSFANISNCGMCVCDRYTLTCDFEKAQDKLTGSVHLGKLIPTQSELEALNLQSNSFEELYVNCKNTPKMTEQRLSRDLLARFSNLKKVIIVRCDLRTIDPDALEGLSRLEEFDASDNSLRQLPDRMFGRLTMKQVKLSENRELQLNNSLAFEGVTLRQLILSKCQLTEFPTFALLKIQGLKELTLSENQISLVPSAAQPLVTRLTVFYLDGNPLQCTCANRWLRESVSWELVSPAAMRKSKLPTCKSPFNLMDIELTKIEPSRFLCPPPRIASVDLQLGQDSASLSCLADRREDGSPLDWFFDSSRLPIHSGFAFQRLVRRVANLDSQRLAVRVADSAGQSAQLNLTIIWPPPQPPQPPQPPLPTLPLPGEAPSGGDAAIPEKPTGRRGGSAAASDNDKQFTLLEMIIAVIGTFMSTSLIFMLSCQFVRWYKRRDKKLWATYVHQHQLPHPQQHQPLPQHPHQAPYSATYSYNTHQPSSHEYDVPRIDQPCLPKPPPPSQTLPSGMGVGGNGVGGGSGCGGSSMSSSDREFLDFNNPRLMYNV
uniref:LRRCT domain-containing protein n=2 Tax=Macrostomum lignano TaxID=282301 RepID=A0A1I8IQD4_9PLAT